MNIDSKDINNLEYIGSGTFGSVYKNDQNALKIYHDMIKIEFGEAVKNPCLRYKSKKLNTLLKLNNEIRNTNLISDIIYVDNIFSGVVYPYHEGNTLSSITFTPSEKKEICIKLVNNACELTNNYIYPLDYKLNNIIYTNSGEVKIIDLDDELTYVRHGFNPILLELSIYSLKKTISYFLDKNHFYRNTKYDKYLSNNYFGKNFYKNHFSYEYLEKYIKSYNNECNFVFINSDDLLLFNKYLKIYDFSKTKIVINFHNANDLVIYNTLIDCKKRGITIYDFILSSDKVPVKKSIDLYLENYNVESYFYVDSNSYKSLFNSYDNNFSYSKILKKRKI